MGHQKKGLAHIVAPLIAAFTVLMLVAASAEAADKSKQPPVKAYDYLAPLPAAKSWTGSYTGASAGGRTTRRKWFVFSTESKSIIYRAAFGWDYQFPGTKSWLA